jgi:hypothetical protein
VAADGWFPATVDGAADLAFLELDPPAPAGAAPATLREWDGGREPLRAFGHPRALGTGVYTRCVPIGTGGPGSAWVQLDPLGPTGWPVGSGFSGAGAATADPRGDVVGVVVAVAGPVERRVGWMIPVERVVGYRPALAALIRSGPTPVRDGEPASVAVRLLPFFAALPALADPHSRQLILTGLRPEISRNADRHSQTNFDILGILHACLRFPGGLAELVNVVEMFSHGSAEMAELDNALRQLPPGAVR